MKITPKNLEKLGFKYSEKLDAYEKDLHTLTWIEPDEPQDPIIVKIIVWLEGDSWAFNHVTIETGQMQHDEKEEAPILINCKNLGPLKDLLKILLKKY